MRKKNGPLDLLHTKVDIVEEKISELKDKSIEIMQIEEQKKKKVKEQNNQPQTDCLRLIR